MLSGVNNNELINEIKSYNKFLNHDSLNKAFKFAIDAHKNQKRDEGVPYIIHPVAVAKILTDLKLDSATITTGLLHDTIEDTKVTYETVKKEFGDGWESEVDVSFSRKPITTYIAIEDDQILGFATYDAAYLNFLGPMGVQKNSRKKGLGKALLFLALNSMKEMGYAYAIIGGVGPAKFYEKTFNAKIIEGSDPGIYKGILSDVPV